MLGKFGEKQKIWKNNVKAKILEKWIKKFGKTF